MRLWLFAIEKYYADARGVVIGMLGQLIGFIERRQDFIGNKLSLLGGFHGVHA